MKDSTLVNFQHRNAPLKWFDAFIKFRFTFIVLWPHLKFHKFDKIKLRENESELRDLLLSWRDWSLFQNVKAHKIASNIMMLIQSWFIKLGYFEEKDFQP